MLAAVAGGRVENLATAAGLLGGDARHIEPNRGTSAAYEAAYDDYRRLFASLTPLFTRDSGA
jgi:sugar (pentulose or hexulose) kinase